MGKDMEKSNLYLKLFKLVFGSVTLFAQENELMLKVRESDQLKESVMLYFHLLCVVHDSMFVVLGRHFLSV